MAGLDNGVIVVTGPSEKFGYGNVNKAPKLQFDQGFTNGRTADAELLCKQWLGNSRAGGKLPGDNRLGEPAANRMREA